METTFWIIIRTFQRDITSISKLMKEIKNNYFLSTGFRLELSEKGKKLVKNFEANLKKSIENCEINKIPEDEMKKIDENENSSLSFKQT